MSVNPYDSPETVGQAPPKPKARGFRLVELLVVIAVIGMLLAFLLPARRGSNVASQRMQCSNHLKQIGVALQNYADVHGTLPPAYTVDADGKPLHSWRTLILPYIEEKALYDTIDLSKPWDDPANQAASQTRISIYQCPSADIRPSHTTYLAIVGAGCCFRPAEGRPMAEIKDDQFQTLMVIEVDAQRAVHWMSPQDADVKLVASFGKVAELSHPGGAQALCANGAVRFLRADSDPAALRALTTVAGGDDEIARKAD